MFMCFLTGGCFKTVLGGRANAIDDDTTYFVPKTSTLCIDCAVFESVMQSESTYPGVLWFIKGQRLSNNDHFNNGHVLPNGTLMITDSSKLVNQSVPVRIDCINNLQDTNIVQQTVGSFSIHLGGIIKTLFKHACIYSF